MAADPNINIASFDKNKGSEVRVVLSTFKDQRLVDMRVYVEFGAAKTPMPTKRGLSLSVGLLPELRQALDAAEDKARSLGWIEGGAA